MINLPPAEKDIRNVFDEVESLAGRWEGMCIHLGLPPSDIDTIAKKYHHDPDDCLMGVLIKWLKMSYDTQEHGQPTWQMLVAAVANRTGGKNPALAKQIAEKHPGEASTSYSYTSDVIVHQTQ